MTKHNLTLPMLCGIGIVAIAASAGLAGSDTGALQCNIADHSANGMRTIQGTVLSPADVSGEYSFAIKSTSNGNSSTISQGGLFTATADQQISVGQMMINADARYSVDFTVTIAGQTFACTQNGAHFT